MEPASTRAPAGDSNLLALAVARIHRSTSFEALTRAFLSSAPPLVDADAFGIYLLDTHLRPEALHSIRVAPGFIEEYEALRMEDPVFRELLQRPRFTHTHELVHEEDWGRHPLCRLMQRWNLRYSIAAPLLAGDRLAGTINFARRQRGYYDSASLERARFLCGEIAFAFDRLMHVSRLGHEIECLRARNMDTAALSERTRQVLELAAAGAGNRAIARRLCISENTVRDHIKRGYALLGVSNRAQLALRMYRPQAGGERRDTHLTGDA